MPAPPRSPRLALGLLAAAVAAGAVGWYVFFRQPALPPAPVEGDPVIAADPAPDDPRLTFDTPFRNVRPGVGYVGDAACAGCHQKVSAAYHAHPMGRSAEWVGAGASPVERYDASAKNPVRVGPHELIVEKENGRVVHRTRTAAGEYAVTADLAIGSGTRGRSYLTFQQSAAWQSPVSWYASDGGRWDLSPGYDLTANGGRRAVVAACLFCHVDRVEAVPGAANRYREPVVAAAPSVGCERCHGPGAIHVAERAANPTIVAPDTSIVNPKHLTPALRGAVCEQCHLQGKARVLLRGRDVFEYRPGMPVELFWSVLFRPKDLADSRRSVGQVEQMEKSRCFTASSGALGCVSCHDPHAAPAPAAKDAFYRGRCQTCHESKPCTAPAPTRAALADNCIACHMPRGDSSTIVHASVTDHSIPRRPVTPESRPADPAGDPLVLFRTGPHSVAGLEADRALGIALADAAAQAPPPPRVDVASTAIDRLTASLKVWPGDAPARTARAAAYGLVGRDADRLLDAKAASRIAPESEIALAELVAAATAAGKFEVAEEAATKWAALSPSAVEPLIARARVRGGCGDWAGAEADARAALSINPIHPRPRLLLAAARHRQGDAAGARREADAALDLIARADARRAASDWYLQMIGR